MTAEAIVYPDTMGGFPPCRGCWEPDKETARTLDPRDGEIKPLCAPCGQTLIHGAPLAPLTGEAWEDIARLHQNEEIDDETVDEAIHYGSPLTLDPGWQAFEQLREAMLKLDRIRSDMFDPADGDRDFLEGEYDIDRENALAKLTGGRK